MPLSEAIFQVLTSDMSEEIQQEAVNAARNAMEISVNYCEVAEYIKKYFDKYYSSPWHCIVGPHFARQVNPLILLMFQS